MNAACTRGHLPWRTDGMRPGMWAMGVRKGPGRAERGGGYASGIHVNRAHKNPMHAEGTHLPPSPLPPPHTHASSPLERAQPVLPARTTPHHTQLIGSKDVWRSKTRGWWTQMGQRTSPSVQSANCGGGLDAKERAARVCPVYAPRGQERTQTKETQLKQMQPDKP